MKLADLLGRLDYKCIQGDLDREVDCLVYDSRKSAEEIGENGLFICIQGAVFDGHAYGAEMAEKGIRTLVVERPVEGLEDRDVAVIQVENSRYAMAHLAAAFFGHPGERLKVIGITGTKGKTTTAYLIKAILERAGRKVGLVGTVETIIGEEHIPAGNTTPESYILQETFAKMVEAGLDTVVMEVSSQALMQHRTQGFVFDCGVFTNLEPDHIGPNEHASFEEYLACKSLLFRQCRLGILNGDDAHWEQVAQGHTCQIELFGLGKGNKASVPYLWAEDIDLVHRPGALGICFRVQGGAAGAAPQDAVSGKRLSFPVEIPTPGRFSVYNALAAIAVSRHFGASKEQIQEALRFARVKGRIEPVQVSEEFTLLIDYAHNAMALESLLTTLREYQPKRLVCLFGCGGNRSRQRRFEMGEVSGRLADLTIITSDNPRFEEPGDIIADIRTGITKTEGKYVEIPDRKEAIAYAIKNGRPGDLIVLAGKGHEDYQEIRGVKYPMDERVLIREILEGR